MEPTDEDVMMQVRSGEVEELGILFERHHRRIYNYCLRLVSSADAAMDLVQEVFYRVLRYRESFRPDHPFAPWLYGMARNACIDHLRRSGREVQGEEEMEVEAPTPSPTRQVERREELDLLAEALRRLPAEKRELLVLARFGSLDYRQIADLLGCTVGALKVRVHRALVRLKDEYGQLAREAT